LVTVHRGLPKTEYARSGDLHIAYQVVGKGPLDLVYVPGWVSHVELAWEEPTLARFLNRLASFSRLIVFDKRGTGLSDRVPLAKLPSLEERMDDLRAVMDAAGSKRAAVFGFSEGGNLAALFTATYPERTESLVLFGCFAKRLRSVDYPWAPTIEQREALYAEVERDWDAAAASSSTCRACCMTSCSCAASVLTSEAPPARGRRSRSCA
jgi:pimeloyl-ACP methyl ester carboxylesterase